MKIVITGPVDSDRLQKIDPSAEIVTAATSEDLLEASRDADVIIGVRPDGFGRLIRNSPNLKWAHTSTAGVDRYLCDELLTGSVVLTCAKDGPAGPNLADHAMALLLGLSRNIAKSARSDTWRRSEFSREVFELSGATAGIVGYGSAGREIAARALVFGMRISATKLHPSYSDIGGVSLLPPEKLGSLVSKSDVVFNTLPGTERTEKIFDKSLFDQFKSNALFVNVGRGSTVDTDALVSALEAGKLRGAGLDVVDPEPLPDGHPLWSMENAIITPHIAGVANQRRERNMKLVEENLRRLLAGEPLKSVVDPVAGY